MSLPRRADWLTPFRKAPIETVCNVVAARLPKGLEKKELADAVGKKVWYWASLRNQTENCVSTPHESPPPRPVLLGRALAAGIRLLGPRVQHVEGFGIQLAQEAVEDDEDAQICSVPRPLQIYEHHSVTVRFSRFTAVRAVLTCSREACGAFMHRLHSPGVLAKLALSSAQMEVMKRGGPILSGQAARWGPKAVNAIQKLLGDRLAKQTSEVFRRIAGSFTGMDVHAKDNDSECTILQGECGPILHLPLQTPASHFSAYVRPVEFQLVQRNGFVEFAEDPSPSLYLGRVRSYSDSVVSNHSSAVPFCLRFDCVNTSEVLNSMETMHTGKEEGRLPEFLAAAHSDEAIDNHEPANAFELENKACEGIIGEQRVFLASDADVTQVPAFEERAMAGTITENIRSFGSDAWTLHAVQTTQEEMRTVQLRNFPKEYTRDALVELMIDRGFAGEFCFVYLPMDLSYGGCLGYADICMDSSSKALELHARLSNYEVQHGAGTFVVETGWSERQGLEELISRYRDSPVMHRSVCDAHRPALFEDGRRVKFPPPTRPLRRPRIRGKQSVSDHTQQSSRP